MQWGHIYAITHRASGRVYIGQTVQKDPMQRIREHKSKLRRDIHTNRHLQRTFNKYGESAFQFRILSPAVPLSLLSEAEARMVSKYGTFNMRAGGERGYHHSVETRARMSASLKRARATNPIYHTETTKQLLSTRHKGRMFTDETRRKISESCRKRWAIRKAQNKEHP